MSVMTVLATLVKPVTAAVQSYQEAKVAKKKIRAAVQQRREELAGDVSQRNHTWELAALEGDSWEVQVIRSSGYLMLAVPIVYTCIDPNAGEEIWQALTIVPGWVIGLLVTIYGWAYGSAPVKNAAAGLVGGALKFPKKG
jgi:hypothetical protein